MDAETANRLGALLSGKLPIDERTTLLKAIALDQEARDILLLAKTPPVESLIKFDHPFSIEGGALIGVHENSFQLISMERVSLMQRYADVVRTIQRLSRTTLPPCFLGAIGILLELDESGGMLPLTIEIQNDRISVKATPGQCESAVLEAWKDGKLFRAAPLSEFAKRSIPEVSSETFLALRFQDAKEGFYLQFAGTEFGVREWWSVCISTALSGRFGDALALLTEKLAAGYASEDTVQRVIQRLRIISQFCTVKDHGLEPIGVFRSLHKPEEIEVPSETHPGWKYLSQRDFNKAESIFKATATGSSGEGDLGTGLALSTHLRLSCEGSPSSELQTSTDEVWKSVFGDVINRLESE